MTNKVALSRYIKRTFLKQVLIFCYDYFGVILVQLFSSILISRDIHFYMIFVQLFFKVHFLCKNVYYLLQKCILRVCRNVYYVSTKCILPITKMYIPIRLKIKDII